LDGLWVGLGRAYPLVGLAAGVGQIRPVKGKFIWRRQKEKICAQVERT
jgi:hypothetical protein